MAVILECRVCAWRPDIDWSVSITMYHRQLLRSCELIDTKEWGNRIGRLQLITCIFKCPQCDELVNITMKEQILNDYLLSPV